VCKRSGSFAGNLEERGLMFVAYQTAISNQFETLDGPAAGGYDLLVGQALSQGLEANKLAEFNQLGGPHLFAPGIAAISAMAT
jgi:hypothetical protein